MSTSENKSKNQPSMGVVMCELNEIRDSEEKIYTQQFLSFRDVMKAVDEGFKYEMRDPKFVRKVYEFMTELADIALKKRLKKIIMSKTIVNEIIGGPFDEKLR